MTRIQSSANLNKSISEVYAFLTDLNNHEQLMPENIYNWTSTADEAKFTIQNMAKLALKVETRVEDESIVLVPSEKAPFDLTLTWKLTAVSASETIADFIIDADLNMMMKMLAPGPLQKLADHQANQLKQILA